MFLLVSIIASCLVSNGLGRVILEHSFRSVALLLASLSVLVLGSYIWRQESQEKCQEKYQESQLKLEQLYVLSPRVEIKLQH